MVLWLERDFFSGNPLFSLSIITRVSASEDHGVDVQQPQQGIQFARKQNSMKR